MKKTLAEWMGKARDLDAAIGARVESASRRVTSSSARQPLEIVHAVLENIDTEVQPSGRGQRAFPYSQIRITLRAATSRDKIRLEVACDGPPTLQDRITERLAAGGCSSAAPAVKVAFVQAAKADWGDPDFHVDFTRGAPPSPAPRLATRLDLSATQGTTEHPTYTFRGGVIAIGRGQEVRDRDNRLLQTNHVAFIEGGGDVNLSVSRRHARIDHDPASGTYRLHDDAGGSRTSVVRDGRGLRVPHGRGLRLRSGDVIAIGDARVLVTID